MKQPIQLLQRHQIDTDRWDETIYAAPDGRVYATTAFLDNMAPGWNALILDDYSMVMPLAVRKKFGINYIFQPAFCQQLGIFSKDFIDKATSDSFLKALQKHFKYAELNGHSGMIESAFPFQWRKNYLLSLKPSFNELQQQFSRSAKRNIHKAIEAGITISEMKDPSQLIQLHQQRYGNRLAQETDLMSIQKLFEQAIGKGNAFCFYAKDMAGNIIGSSGYLLYKDRLVFLINGNLEQALHHGATHLLKQYVIEKFAGTELWMDFEGSDTASFARFYEQYGAAAVDNYPLFIFNNLPPFIKLAKNCWEILKRKMKNG